MRPLSSVEEAFQDCDCMCICLSIPEQGAEVGAEVRISVNRVPEASGQHQQINATDQLAVLDIHPLALHLDCFMSDIDNSRSPSKRKRGDDLPSQPAVLVNPLRSDIWYEDGNIILQAGGTQFKVYQGTLADNSTVFKKIFSFPQPLSKDTQMVEGCPVVDLSESAQEVRCMLEAIYQRKCVAPSSFYTKLIISTAISDMHPSGRRYHGRSSPPSFSSGESTTSNSCVPTRRREFSASVPPLCRIGKGDIPGGLPSKAHRVCLRS